MPATKVLVVDDSFTMRALISGALERIPEVKVVGLADGAAEARQMVAQFNPDVITLDIEMPGMNGLEYLHEVMTTKPRPVIMFSTRTEAGAADSVEALRLGAIDCFPKPKVATPAELDKIIAKLGKRIKAAKTVELRPPVAAANDAAAVPPLNWNGRLVALGGDAANTRGLFELFAGFPENCPPTILIQHLAPGLGDTLLAKLDEEVAPRVVMAADGMALEQGTIYFAPPGDAHVVIDTWPGGRIRMLPRDPIAGERPSISVLLASFAKAAGRGALGMLLSSPTGDGGAGLKAVSDAGGFSLALAESGTGYTLSRNQASQAVETADLARVVLKLCSRA